MPGLKGATVLFSENIKKKKKKHKTGNYSKQENSSLYDQYCVVRRQMLLYIFVPELCVKC